MNQRSHSASGLQTYSLAEIRCLCCRFPRDRWMVVQSAAESVLQRGWGKETCGKSRPQKEQFRQCWCGSHIDSGCPVRVADVCREIVGTPFGPKARFLV